MLFVLTTFAAVLVLGFVLLTGVAAFSGFVWIGFLMDTLETSGLLTLFGFSAFFFNTLLTNFFADFSIFLLSKAESIPKLLMA